ncbi:MAG TPA: hypothetical protein PLJ35_08445 [Anaerolineae bacterium]|nr:hypothetical protein [Anaerolineae bacterium]HOQ98837.1 hypothetical protein [Anaerolineae bacterium]HPL30149.1 hypothetical protein [Anaerolineae bacterium]
MSQSPTPAGPPLCPRPADALLATKLYIPPLRPGLVSRPRLLARLDQGPAGSGKTTLLSEWLARGGHPAAWLSLEPADGDVVRFLSYSIAALRTVLPGTGERCQALLNAAPLPPPESLLTTLINEIVAAAPASRPIILVLDDCTMALSRAEEAP